MHQDGNDLADTEEGLERAHAASRSSVIIVRDGGIARRLLNTAEPSIGLPLRSGERLTMNES